MFILTQGIVFKQYEKKKIMFTWNIYCCWYWSLKTAAVIVGILNWPNVLLQVPVLYTCSRKVWFSVSVWKSSYFNWVTTEGVWKLNVLLQVFIFDWKYLWKYQLYIYIYVFLSYSFKSSHDKVINSWNIYWNWIIRQVFSWTHTLLEIPGIYMLISSQGTVSNQYVKESYFHKIHVDIDIGLWNLELLLLWIF